MIYTLCITLLACSVLFAYWRLVKGPTPVDRILGLDGIAASFIGFVAVTSVQQSTAQYLEVILIISLLAFFSTVILVRCVWISRPVQTNKEQTNADVR
jgi:multisubunit Na+/H+ antiporter MnhF subunit